MENKTNTTEKLQYEAPAVEVLGKLSQLIQGDSGKHRDFGPNGSQYDD